MLLKNRYRLRTGEIVHEFLQALVGAHDFNNLDSSAKWIKIEKIIIHKFSSLTHVNDIAIWKLAKPVDIDTER